MFKHFLQRKTVLWVGQDFPVEVFLSHQYVKPFSAGFCSSLASFRKTLPAPHCQPLVFWWQATVNVWPKLHPCRQSMFTKLRDNPMLSEIASPSLCYKVMRRSTRTRIANGASWTVKLSGKIYLWSLDNLHSCPGPKFEARGKAGLRKWVLCLLITGKILYLDGRISLWWQSSLYV